MNGIEIEKEFNNPSMVNYNKIRFYQKNRYYRELFKREAAKISFLDFVLYTYPDYRVNWHHKLMCAKLDDWVNGKIDRLMIFTPPRHGKSLLVSERLPAYILGKNPKYRIILTSYASTLANKMSRRVRECMIGTPYKRIFPKTVIGGKDDKYAVQEWETSVGGGQRSAGVGGGIVGMGFDYAIIDDPHKDRKETESEVMRRSVMEWYKGTLYHRAQKNSKILIIQTRWHEDDLCGGLIEHAKTNPSGDKWEILNLPAILENEPCEDDPRQNGEVLWPDEFSLEDLNRKKIALGSYNWASLYQQKPQPTGGGKIKRHWFKYIKEEEISPNLRWNRFWDPAVSEKESNDHTASICGAVDLDGNVYLKNMIRGQWEWPDAHKNIISTSNNEGVPIGFELGGQQKGFLQELLRDTELMNVSVKGYHSDTDKLTRALPWIARAEAGKVFLVKGSWINEFLNECQKFTGHGDKHDDQIDAVSGVYLMCENSTKGKRKSGAAW